MYLDSSCSCIFFFQAEDGIRDLYVTGVQTCALPIFLAQAGPLVGDLDDRAPVLPRDAHGRTGAGGRVGPDVGEQIVDDLAQPAGVALHDQRLRSLELEPPVRLDGARGLDGLADELGEVDLLAFERAA